jgi:hypothetical protein
VALRGRIKLSLGVRGLQNAYTAWVLNKKQEYGIRFIPKEGIGTLGSF